MLDYKLLIRIKMSFKLYRLDLLLTIEHTTKEWNETKSKQKILIVDNEHDITESFGIALEDMP